MQARSHNMALSQDSQYLKWECYAACSSLQEGEHCNITAVQVSYARRHFMHIASLKTKGLQLFSLYM